MMSWVAVPYNMFKRGDVSVDICRRCRGPNTRWKGQRWVTSCVNDLCLMINFTVVWSYRRVVHIETAVGERQIP